MPRKDQGWVTFQLPETERQLLESYCEQAQRSKTDVLRELVRTLERPIAAARSQSAPSARRTLQISARNVFPAIVKQIRCGSVNAEIVLEIAPTVEAVAVITRSSAENLHLQVGRSAYALIKSSDVMVAIDE
jgi:molybdopterin-binding protein